MTDRQTINAKDKEMYLCWRFFMELATRFYGQDVRSKYDHFKTRHTWVTSVFMIAHGRESDVV